MSVTLCRLAGRSTTFVTSGVVQSRPAVPRSFAVWLRSPPHNSAAGSRGTYTTNPLPDVSMSVGILRPTKRQVNVALADSMCWIWIPGAPGPVRTPRSGYSCMVPGNKSRGTCPRSFDCERAYSSSPSARASRGITAPSGLGGTGHGAGTADEQVVFERVARGARRSDGVAGQWTRMP